MILFIWNAFKSSTGNDYKPRLWRKVAESGKGQVRKVRAKWTVRKNLSLFSLQLLYFEPIQLIPTPYTFSRTRFFLTEALKTVFPEGSFDMPRDTFLHYQTDSLQERGEPRGRFM